MDQDNESIPGKLLQAFGEFNRGDWFECHETLEDLWVGSQGEMRNLYQGILQLAVSLHHWRNGNYGGAISLLESGTAYLSRVRPICLRLDIAALISSSEVFRKKLQDLGAERMMEVHAQLIPRLRLVCSAADEPE